LQAERAREVATMMPPTIEQLAGAPEHAKRKPKRKQPTQRTLEHMRELGYVCAIVEKWNPHARIRQDMFGFIDVLCVKGEDIVGVQACSGAGGDSAERVRKITEHANWPLICEAIRVVVQSWRKNAAGRWVLREVEL
jgi:hypothetical protein